MKDVWQQHANAAAAKYGVDPSLVGRVIQAESAWNPKAASPKGAMGLMQLMPGTAAELGVDPTDPMQNIDGGVRYLAQMLKASGGDQARALASYNWGPGNVQKQGMERMPAETRAYLDRVLGTQQGASPMADPLASVRSGGAPTNVGDELPPEAVQFLGQFRSKYAAQPAAGPAAAPAQGGMAPGSGPAPAAPPGAAVTAQPGAGPQAGPPPATPNRLQPLTEGNEWVPGTSTYGMDAGPLGRVALPKGPTDFVTGMVGRGADLAKSVGGRVADFAGLPQTAERIRGMGDPRPSGVDSNSWAAKAGGLTTDLAVTGGAAGAAGRGLSAASSLASTAPKLQAAMDAAGRALGSFGGTSGLPRGGADLAIRSAGGAGAGAIGAQITDPESTGLAAGLGAAIPVAGRLAGMAGEQVGAAVRPFTEGGRKQIAAKFIEQSVADPATAGRRLANPQNSFVPLTTTEILKDPGISSLQRALKNSSKDFSDDLTIREAQQNQGRLGALRGFSDGVNSPDAIRQAQQSATKPTYDWIEKYHADTPLSTQGVRRATNNALSGARGQTDAVSDEVINAVTDKGRVKRFGKAPTANDPDIAWRPEAPMKNVWGARQNIDQRLYGGNGLDAKATATAAAGELSAIRKSITTQLHKIPEFKNVESVYKQYSRKAEAADVLKSLADRAPANVDTLLGDPLLTGAKLTQALKQVKPDDWKKLNGAQRKGLMELSEELRNATATATAGMATGSNTVQNQTMAGNLPLAMNAAATMIPGGSLVAGMVGAGTKSAKAKIEALMGEALLDPAKFAALRQYQGSPMLTDRARQLGIEGASRPVAPVLSQLFRE